MRFVCGLSLFDQQHMHALPWLGAWKYCEFVHLSGKTENWYLNVHCAFYSMVTNCMHLKVHSKSRCSVKGTGMPWSGARKYCQFSGKTENWYAFTGAQSKTQVALVRCSISVKELSIMHLITDYLRTHSAPLNLRHPVTGSSTISTQHTRHFCNWLLLCIPCIHRCRRLLSPLLHEWVFEA